MHRLIAAGICAGALLLGPEHAYAHAHLERSNPAAGSAVATAPKEIVLWFTEALEPNFSGIVVQDDKGAAMEDGTASLNPGNSAELRVAVKPLPPGTYKVIWHALSVDTHRTQGDFTFRVGQ
jgi:methionine-rich copper-binding protein CopC